MHYLFLALALLLMAGCTIKPEVKPLSALDACTREAGDVPLPEYGFGGVTFETLNAQTAVKVCSERVAANPDDADGKFLLARAWTKYGNYKKAFPLLESSCGMGSDAGCTLLGSYYLNGFKPAVFDNKRAAELYEQACAHDHAPACMNLGKLYLSGSGVPKAPEKGEALIYRQCTRGFMTACHHYVNSVHFLSMPTTEEKYLYAARKTCESGLDCYYYWLKTEQRRNEAVDRLDVDFLEASDKENAEVAGTACTNGNAEACERLGEYYMRGSGVETSLEKALVFYRQACDSGRKRFACFQAAALLLNSGGDKKEAVDLVSQSCREGEYMTACFETARFYLVDPSLSPDDDAARRLLQHACKKGHGESCALLKQLESQ